MLSSLERLYVRHAHPVNVIMTLIGILWGAYFLWQHDLLLAFAFGVGFPLIGHIAVIGEGEEELSDTWLGELMLHHAHPISSLFHFLSIFIMALGFYANTVEMVMWGFTVLLAGHLWGWGRVRMP